MVAPGSKGEMSSQWQSAFRCYRESKKDQLREVDIRLGDLRLAGVSSGDQDRLGKINVQNRAPSVEEALEKVYGAGEQR